MSLPPVMVPLAATGVRAEPSMREPPEALASTCVNAQAKARVVLGCGFAPRRRKDPRGRDANNNRRRAHEGTDRPDDSPARSGDPSRTSQHAGRNRPPYRGARHRTGPRRCSGRDRAAHRPSPKPYFRSPSTRRLFVTENTLLTELA
jgi:hypothetical protein